jgi:hypothetical protein
VRQPVPGRPPDLLADLRLAGGFPEQRFARHLAKDQRGLAFNELKRRIKSGHLLRRSAQSAKDVSCQQHRFSLLDAIAIKSPDS